MVKKFTKNIGKFKTERREKEKEKKKIKRN